MPLCVMSREEEKQFTAGETVSETNAEDKSGCDVEQTVIIFDWDDTLCPSSWITANRPKLSYFRSPPNEARFVNPLDRLQNAVLSLLEASASLGKVIIITNAKDTWITTSCTHFLPKVLPILSSIPQIYARDTWSMWEASSLEKRRLSCAALNASELPSTPAPSDDAGRLLDVGRKVFLVDEDLDQEEPSLLWKKLAFGVEITNFYKSPDQAWSNVVSIGDADYERIATQNVVNTCSPMNKKSRAKTIKMFDDPSIEQLILQLERLKTILPLVVKHGDSIDIEIKPNDLPSYD